ncbi:MAG: c-type cytochrome [Paracoccaceae bacterium]|nr:c-type cytochrome [Paracoccaceae bacterium]
MALRQAALLLLAALWAPAPGAAEQAAPAAVEAEAIGDRARGAEIFRQCAGCHRVGAGAENGIGPHLNRVFGRRAGSLEGFDYSEGIVRMGRDGLVWTLETLDRYIENPRTFVSRTRMNFAGLKDPADRADVLAYLRDFSDRPSNIPEAEPTARATEYALDPTVLALEGDPAYGEYLAGECTTCHQASGAADGIPGVTGWPEEDFVLALHAYKDRIRPHPVMQMIAGRLGNEEIAALAAYFATLDQ